MSKQSNVLIDQFINDYLREYDYHLEAARICHSRCEGMLALRGIRAMITHRAKSPTKLRAKLEQRNRTKGYTSAEEIRADIIDLAGVRIALYFPGDRVEVAKLIEDSFDVKSKKAFPEQSKRKSGTRFNGYHANHFRIQMPAQSLPQEQRRYSDAAIEVQLGSVLMHAWAEVEHDLIYKPDSGAISEDETAIIDELNGLVLAGEIALERLQRALERRLSIGTAVFENHYELAAFIHNSLRNAAKNFIPGMGRVDVLWELLREVGKNNAAALSPILSSLSASDNDEPLADQLADEILTAHPELYRRYVAIQSQHAGQVSTEPSPVEANKKYGGLGEFITNWVLVEGTLNEVASVVRAPGPKRGAPIEQLRSVLDIPKELTNLLKRLRQMRNQLIHGIDIPSKQILEPAIKEFQEIFAFLRDHPNQAVRDAYRRARRNLGLEDN